VKLTHGMKQCQTILKHLMTHKFAWPFNTPVDPLALNLPDYNDIIKNPMDLGTVKQQLASGLYENEDDFAEDVRLVWANALRYNQPGSDICIMASELADFFESRFVKLRSTIDEKRSPEPSGMTETIIELRDSMRSVQKELEKMRREKATNGGSKAPGKKEDVRPMSFEEEKRLSLSINNLPSESLGMVVKIINERMPHLTGQGEVIEIDIDALDAATLRHLERYIKTVQRKRRSKPDNQNIAQAKVTEAGTQSRIEDVERKLKELSEKAQAITQKTGIPVSPFEAGQPGAELGLGVTEASQIPKPEGEEHNSSESDSSSGSDSSDSDSEDSDSSDSSETDSEADNQTKGAESKEQVSNEKPSSDDNSAILLPLGDTDRMTDGVGDESHQGILAMPTSPVADKVN